MAQINVSTNVLDETLDPSSSRATAHASPSSSSSASSAAASSSSATQPVKGRKPVSRAKKSVAAVAGAVTTSFLKCRKRCFVNFPCLTGLLRETLPLVKHASCLCVHPDSALAHTYLPFAVTPFDVIKTRLQTQTNPEPLFVPSSHLAAPVFSSARTSAASASASTSRLPASGNPATCCQQTFFTANSHEASLLCKFDPRIDVPQKGQTATATAARAASGRSPHYSPPPARSRAFPSSCSFSHTTSFQSPTAVRTFPAAAHSVAACAFPDQRVAARELGAYARDKRLTGLWDGVIKVGRSEGARGLWRGLSPTLMMTVPSQVTYMTCYDYLRGFFLSLERQAPSESLSTSASPTSPSLQIITAHSLLSSLMAGALARAVSATLVTPLELVRTRLQASSAGSSSFSSILASLRADMRSQGPRVLWRGLSPTLWRDVPFSAIYFAGYEGMKRSLTGGGLGEGNASGGAEEFGIAFLSGAVSGSVAAVLTQPFDLIKTRLQAPSPPASSSSSPSSSRSSPSRPGRPSPASSASTSTRLLSVVAQIVRDEGAAGLFRGLSPRVAKVAPACGVMIASFEVVGRALAEAE